MKANIGDIIRYGTGPTALMLVTSVSEKHGGIEDRYYGDQFYGGAIGVYESNVKRPSTEDLNRWKEQHNES